MSCGCAGKGFEFCSCPGANDERRYLLQMLDHLRQEYERARKPYLDKLVELESLRASSRVLLTPAQVLQFLEMATR